MLKSKLINLENTIKDMRSVLIAYSGGVDSTFLLKVAVDTLGNKAVAVTARSETYPESEFKEACNFAGNIGAKHIVINTEELQNTRFRNNPAKRCYWCKKELFGKLKDIAYNEDIKFVVDGANYDDTKDYRPGIEAADKLGVRHPLIEAGMTKEDIRAISHKLKLPTWNKPAYACLASRIPYGEKITEEKLMMVNKAEEFLKGIGIKQVRVRHHSYTARIEVDRNSIEKLCREEIRDKIVKELKKLGYKYVTVDLEGYRSGSMNEVL